ncbi:TPA: DUF551 domain-containing protein [Raoultella ornithinolytica]
MTSKLTREQLHERARENVKALKMASRQHAFESAREEILADLQLAELALAAMDSEPVAEILSSRPGNDTSTIDRALPVGTQLYRHAQQLVVPPMQHWEELCREYPDMSIGDAIIRAAWWNHCRAAMLQAGNSPVIPDGLIAAVNRLLDSDGSRGCYSAIQCGDAHDEIERLLAAAPHDTPALNSVQSIVTVPGKWIPVSERVPENDGAYLCWDKRYVTTYAFIFGAWQANQFIAKNITHWMPLPAAPQEVKSES